MRWMDIEGLVKIAGTDCQGDGFVSGKFGLDGGWIVREGLSQLDCGLFGIGLD
jgi:hypothetical protein